MKHFADVFIWAYLVFEYVQRFIKQAVMEYFLKNLQTIWQMSLQRPGRRTWGLDNFVKLVHNAMVTVF